MTQKAESQENYGGPAELRTQKAEFEAAERANICHKELDRKKLCKERAEIPVRILSE